jgi:hypothetical protein
MNMDDSPLDHLHVSTPCTARWEEMAGDERTRFCSHCSLNVYNLSAMRHDEAEALIEEKEGRLCVRFYRRSDGTVLTQDCPVGLRTVRQRIIRSVRNVAATIAALVGGAIGLGSIHGCSTPEQVLGGLVALPPSDSTMQQDTVQTGGHR